MRKLATATLALPVLSFVYLSAFIHRSVLTRVFALALATALVAAGLLVGLPSKGVSANAAPTYGPKHPTAQPNIVTDLSLGSAFGIEFSKPMDQASVAWSLTVLPKVAYHVTWDSKGQTASLVPDSHWAPDTYYTVDVAATALDRDGLKLGNATDASFLTAPATSGKIAASTVIGDSIAPTTTFVLTFDATVKLAMVQTAFNILPLVGGKISGDDSTDADSHAFTFTPDAPLALGTTYTVSFSAATMVDAAGAPLAWIAPITASTQAVPSVVRFRPRDGTTGVDPGQAISVRFTTKMDEATTTPAFSVTANGKPVTGKTYWAENDTVLVLTPSASLPAGAKIVATVSTDATSSGGLNLSAAATATSTVDKPSTVKISTGGGSVGSGQWQAAESYYLQLMNCTRTGGWVVSGGLCRSSGPHTLPAARALSLDPGISTNVARPFAKFMADRGILNHYANGTPGQRLARAGYTSYQWAENIGSPSSVMAGMVAVEIFYQSEAPCRCEHYKNLMNPAFDRAGIGVWVTGGRVRVVIDFYHP
ncbi:MAG TPA: Ig-like domain-containing protein [Candidatus Limnocylindrales bacterium]